MTEPTEREVFEALFADLHGTKDSIPLHRYTIKWRDRRDRFTAMLDAGAYLDAALMLVPDGWETTIYLGGENANVQMETEEMRQMVPFWPIDATAETPALALCAAIEAAIAYNRSNTE